jgi:predicted aspartyl protease
VPHFTLQFQANGPQLQLYVGVSSPRQSALHAANQPVPLPKLIRGLIDTGASTTAIDPTIIQALGLQPTGSMAIVTPSTGATPVQVNTYDVGIVIPLATAGQTHVIGALQVFESSLTVQGIQALIGRDVLSNSLLVYDGRANIFSLAF